MEEISAFFKKINRYPLNVSLLEKIVETQRKASLRLTELKQKCKYLKWIERGAIEGEQGGSEPGKFMAYLTCE